MGVPLDYVFERAYCCASHGDHLLQLKQNWLARLKKRAELQLIAAIEREALNIGVNEFIGREALYAIADRLAVFQELSSSAKAAALDRSMVGHSYDVQLLAKYLAEEYGDAMRGNVGLED